MYKKLVVAAAALLALTAGCDTLNIGTGLPNRGPSNVVVTVPAGMIGGVDATWSASFVGGVGATTILWNFGGGANPNTVGPVAATSPNSQTVNMVNPSITTDATYTYTVTVTDSLGLSGVATGSYTVGPTPNQNPVIAVSAGAGTTSLTVTVSDPDGDDIDVTVTPPAGFTVAPANGTVNAGGPGDLVFNFTATDIFAGGSGTATFDADDGAGGTASTTGNVVSGPIVLAADTLYAIPLATSATTADTVTIVVATGVPANAFNFMNGCRVTAPSDWSYAATTFNIGVPGGAAGDTDGFWTDMAPAGGFLLAPDNFIAETDIGGGSSGIDFNCTPIGGSDVTTSEGALFNFGANFASAGTYDLGFQDVSGVSRTYYTDSTAAPDQFWGDITNNHAGIANSIDVN